MKNKLLIAIIVGVASTLIYSCQDFIAVNLAKKSITILAPANNTLSSSYSQLFKWEDIKGADSYQLQLVKPNFSSITQFILDTTIHATQFAYTLQPGIYQWRVRAKNNSSETDYVTYNLTIDTTLNLASQKVVLSSPVDNYYSNLLANTFTWQTMPNANSYVFQVLSGGSAVYTQSLTTTTVNYTFTTEGAYQWRVFAQNNFSNSAYDTRTINIDNTAPGVPVLVSPIPTTLDTIKANPVPLKWNCVAGTGFSATDSTHLLISTDSTFAVVTSKDTTIANTTSPTVYNFHSAIVGTYYFWKVQAIDKSGNKSAYFTRRRFKRNP